MCVLNNERGVRVVFDISSFTPCMRIANIYIHTTVDLLPDVSIHIDPPPAQPADILPSRLNR